MGLNLRQLREKSGKNIMEVSKALGVSHPSYIKWETGRGYPTADKLPAIAALFCCTIDELFPSPSSPGRGQDDIISSHNTSIPTEGGKRHGA